MRRAIIALGGEASAGDVVCVSYSAKRGGKTTAGHIVLAGESLDDVAKGLAFGINTHWCQPLFSARAAPGPLVEIMIADGADDVSLSWYVEKIVGHNANERVAGGSATLAISDPA